MTKIGLKVNKPWLKPSISSHSKPRTMAYTRLLKCFVLITLCCKTKHLRSLIRESYKALND